MRKHLSWLLIVVPFLGMVIANLIVWPKLGEKIPIHWNWLGVPDSWGGKGSIWILPSIFFWSSGLLGLITIKLPGSDDVSNRKAIHWLQAGLGALFLYLHIALLTRAMQSSRDLAFAFMNMGSGVFMLCLGLSLKHCKPNRFVGIRTKWTLNSEDNWEKTHRFASSAFNMAGIWVAFLAFYISFSVTAGIFLAINLMSMAYSYRLHKLSQSPSVP